MRNFPSICYLIPALNTGGTERLIVQLADELIKLNWKVYLITFSTSNQFVGLPQGLEVHHIKVGYKVRLLSVDKELGEYERLLNRIRPDIIHSNSLYTDWISRLAHLNYKPKFITHYHLFYEAFRNSDNIPLKARLIKWIDSAKLQWLYYKTKTSFIFVSNRTQQFYRNSIWLPALRNGEVIPNPVNLAKFSCPPKTMVGPQVRILSMGRLDPVKNYGFQISLAEYLKELGIQFVWDVFGDGILRDELQEVLSKSSVNGCYRFIGNVDDPSDIISKYDILVHTSFEETFSLAILEGLAAGLIVICSEGSNNLIKDGENGFVLENYDAKAYADRVNAVIQKPQLVAQISSNAVKTAITYSLERYVDSVVAFYYNLFKK